MGKIKVLPAHEVQKIAAGEVIERPASVVKELIENSLDAGATQITLYLEEGGKKLIRILDNGCGMSAKDAHACIQNHATSKLTSVQDLPHITTFGFRGEALASIATVSHFTLITREPHKSTGLMLTVEEGIVISSHETAHPAGTEIVVHDLFFNVPARQKFLKKDETEWRAIHQLVTALALEHRHCTFTLHHNNRQILHAPAALSIKERMAQLIDTAVAEHLLDCTLEPAQKSGIIALSGVFTRPTRTRYDRGQIFFFVNHRWVKNHKLAQALLKGYDNILPPQQYPLAAIFLTLDPLEVDINVHPRKEEVQFLHPVTIERAIQESVRTALNATVLKDLRQPSSNKSFDQSPSPQLFRPATSSPTSGPYRVDQGNNQTSDTENFKFSSNQPLNPHATRECDNFCSNQNSESPQDNAQNFKPDQNRSEHDEQQRLPDMDVRSSFRLIGQLMDTYLLIENNEGLLLIDQHAAHERILYELFEARFKELTPIELLFPQLVTLSIDECNALLPHLGFFHEHGIEIELFGDNKLTVRAVPAPLKNINLTDIMRTAASWILEGILEEATLKETDLEKKLYEKLRAMMACKAAVKAGDKLTEVEMLELVAKLSAIQHRTTCPHGRPTTWRFTAYEIEKFFQRCS
ncbi:TPA: DNA mismatch repair endonuclease MutL [Candidatus Dependentiae bacterium]|nr:MAG: mismatch repair protein MutL protein [candidate division TM6 bacterium GW2011_GWF2_43_87]HBL98371.1 DNA mismatch repair endonuclease MutL [Candidatus Dependentiae bacterium]